MARPKISDARYRRDFLKELADYAQSFRRTIEAEVDGFTPDKKASLLRRARVRDDYQFFAETYFPHYLTKKPSRMHKMLFAELPGFADDPRGLRMALAAPRGEAKSTLVSLILLLWCDITGRKHFIPLIMDSYELAAVAVEAVKAELEANPRLKTDFPEACGRGRVWREGVIVTANNCKVQAFGWGTRMRGLRHGPHRPDLVIMDDLENDQNVLTPAQRDKQHKWVMRTVLRLGPPDGSMDVIMAGVIIHYNSVLSRLLKNPMWQGHTFKGVIRMPDRMELWDQWEEVLRNAEGDKRAAAREFYEQHKKQMDAGAEVSWPEGRPLYVLMEIRAEDKDSFNAEIQNDPLDDDAPFAKLTFWVEPCPRWIMFGACDPSMGKHKKRGDPSGILVGGYDRQEGRLAVLAAEIARRLPDMIIEDIIRLQAQFRCLVWMFEATAFQEYVRMELVKRSAQRGMHVPALPDYPHTDKDLRILSLQSHISNGLIQFHPDHKTFNQQVMHWPMADHDEGPDTLEKLWRMATRGMIAGPAVATGTLESADHASSLPY